MNTSSIYVEYGNNPKQMINELLKKIKIENDIPSDALIGLKPNLVVAKPFNSGATTSPKIIEGIIEYLQEKNHKNIVILEGSWVGDRTSSAFKVCGYEDISKKYNIPLFDLQKDKYKSYDAGDGVKINICDKAMEIDYLINIPVLKGHCQTTITCALKNLKGCIPNNEKRKFHTMGLHKPIAYLNKVLKQNLIIVDGLMGDLSFEEGGNPVQMDRIIVGKDPVLMDAYAAELMGYDINEIPYIRIADEIGVGSCNLENADIIELNNNHNTKKIRKSHKVKKLSQYVDENQACSACYGTLIHALDRLNENDELRKIKGKISIGQGFKEQKGQGVGCGNCTKGFEMNIAGCPPKAKDIVDFLEK